MSGNTWMKQIAHPQRKLHTTFPACTTNDLVFAQFNERFKTGAYKTEHFRGGIWALIFGQTWKDIEMYVVTEAKGQTMCAVTR